MLKNEFYLATFNPLSLDIVHQMEPSSLKVNGTDVKRVYIADIGGFAMNALIHGNAGKIAAALRDNTLIMAFGPGRPTLHWQILSAGEQAIIRELDIDRKRCRTAASDGSIMDMYVRAAAARKASALRLFDWVGGAGFSFKESPPTVIGESQRFDLFEDPVSKLALNFLEYLIRQATPQEEG